MVDKNTTRRRFLVAAITYSGLISTGMAAVMLRAGSVWAKSAEGNAGELTRMARLLFPHDGVADDVYAEVINSILTDTVNDAAMLDMLNQAVAALNAAQKGDWFEAGTNEQIAAMQAVEGEAFFAAVLGNVQARFYNHPEVWKLINYPGSSVEFGGYVNRGFDDIDWLPETE